MANSTEVTNVNDGLVTKSNYRGNVHAIPVTIGSAGATSHVVSKLLPQEARVVYANLTPSSGDVDIGYSGALTAVKTGASSACEFAGNVDVGGKILLATTDATASVSGVILIATNE